MRTTNLHLFPFMHFFYLLSFFYIIRLSSSLSFTSSPSKLQAVCHDDERSALLLLKQSFSLNQSASLQPSARPKFASWMPDVADCCSWDGVECNEATGHVIGLDISSSFLYGSINSSSTLFSLVHLRRLNLADNHFNYSQIPSGIARLSSLSHLNLSSFVFSGHVPSQLSAMSNLVSLDLSSNLDPQSTEGLLKLDEPIFRSLAQNLTNLKILYLAEVHINSTVPETLANMSSLSQLSLHDCGLYGEFPTSIFMLPNLQVLWLQFNENLTGYLPEFQQRSPLKELSIFNTGFFGSIPASLANLTQLTKLELCFTELTGQNLSWLGA